LALGGEIADIVHLATPFLGTAYMADLVEVVRHSAERAGREASTYEIDVTVPVSILPDAHRARRLAKVTAAMGVTWMSQRAADPADPSQYPAEFEPALGLVEPVTSRWQALGDEPLPEDLADRIDDDVLSLFSISGDRDECVEGLETLVRALPAATGIRVKLPSLTSDDAFATYTEMIVELGQAVEMLGAKEPTT
jgi:alkanesulfonate monooxygenase SsuD/methylene tetrahydromethanopterin reductase-like flavin-dependent oxidoreductase (luciferase family)